ncbi:MFS amine transporter, variant [Blastomyces gilchristii SLH14081]|uniref:MFS amine transporter n=1 Tax=Blastomyces gilchristii (strain SLH14081) TaxID=559298 RepID=A0A179UQD8_BLAGS|nr:MFS amine transporter [Blastomyces gilchristii SLH14081]XP_031579270.1 MFS amine transporter, variant [Blastomyces gilchristii SLH14081]OAT10315.1 MFS amine transporter [Blastomyces gilchristii SLH14081]OAT10316.1 MFS amine transporter, variant [Blastomyces gilchristii SLH14081]
MAHGSKLPWGLSFRSSEGFILLVVSAALFTDTLVYGVIVPIVPLALTDRAGVPHEEVQKWVSILLATYGATFLVGSPLFGYFADRSRSRQLPFVIGLVAMILATSLFLVGRSLGLFIVARAMQGLSGGAVGAVGMALAVDSVPKERIGQAMGYVSLALTWGVLFGPIVGGVMFTKAGYYAAFAVPIALLCIDIVLRLLMIEKKVASRLLRERLGARNHTETCDHPSPPGSSSRTQSLGSDSEDTIDEQSPLIQRATNGNSQPNTTKTLIIYHLLKDSRILVNLFATVIQSIVWTAFETTLPLFVMDKFNWTPSGTGILFLIFSLPCLFGVVIGKGADRWGSRIFGTSGFTLAGGPLILLRLVQHNTTGQQVLLGALLVLVGLAITVVQVITMTEISHAVDELEERDPVLFSGPSAMGQGYALYNMAFAAGQLLGPIIGGFVITSVGWAGMNLALGLICFASAIPMALFCGGTIASQKGKMKVRDLSGGAEAYES